MTKSIYLGRVSSETKGPDINTVDLDAHGNFFFCDQGTYQSASVPAVPAPTNCIEGPAY